MRVGRKQTLGTSLQTVYVKRCWKKDTCEVKNKPSILVLAYKKRQEQCRKDEEKLSWKIAFAQKISQNIRTVLNYNKHLLFRSQNVQITCVSVDNSFFLNFKNVILLARSQHSRSVV